MHVRFEVFVSALALLGASASLVPAQGSSRPIRVSFERSVLPILKRSCYKCHQATYKDAKGITRRPKSRLRLDGKGWILKGGKNGAALVPGKPSESQLYNLISLDPDDDDVMPNKGEPLTKRQIDLIRRWIEGGADFGRWKGKPGPGADIVAKAQLKAKPKVLSTSNMLIIEQLGSGVKPALAAAIQHAAGQTCQVVPVVPGSPLLRVAFVSNESSVQDSELASLEPLASHITYLSLAKTRITDDALASVGRMKKLTKLDLNGTEITDDGLKSLAELSELRSLNLHSTAVTDKGVQMLGQLKNLERIYLWNSRVTPEGVSMLRELLPGAKISHKMDIPKVDPNAGNNNRRRRRR